MNQIRIEKSQKRIVPCVWMSDADVEDQYEIVLSDDAEVLVLGVFLGCNKFCYKNYVTVVHEGLNTKARVFARGVLLEDASLDFSGMLRVERGAKGADTFFDARFMVLSEKARARTFPGLEINENEIAKGGHAATVSRIREEDLFYMMSRGLSHDQARSLVVRGFFDPLLVQLELHDQDTLRNAFELQLVERLKLDHE